MTGYKHAPDQPAEFLAFVEDCPYLVEWQPAGETGSFTFRLADQDFAAAWAAADPVTITAPVAAVSHWGTFPCDLWRVRGLDKYPDLGNHAGPLT